MRRLLPFLFLFALTLTACDDDSAGVGTYCDYDDECETGMCYTGSDPGYCTAPCESEGSLNQCPEDTICKRIHGGPRRCLRLCEYNGDCAPNAECSNVPDSSFRACEPYDD